MNAMSALDADSLRAGTHVEVETTSGSSYRGKLTRSHDGHCDVELRCAGHNIRLLRFCVRRVRALDDTMPPH
jgi:hypothetical protein